MFPEEQSIEVTAEHVPLHCRQYEPVARKAGAAGGTNPRHSQLANMKTSAKYIGEHLRRIFATVTQRPLQWSQIDALATLEEKEEAQGRELTEKSQGKIKPQSGGEV